MIVELTSKPFLTALVERKPSMAHPDSCFKPALNSAKFSDNLRKDP